MKLLVYLFAVSHVPCERKLHETGAASLTAVSLLFLFATVSCYHAAGASEADT